MTASSRTKFTYEINTQLPSDSLFVHSRVFSDKKTLLAGALDLANSISKKSPVAIQGSKVNLVYARDHSVQESLDFQVNSKS